MNRVHVRTRDGEYLRLCLEKVATNQRIFYPLFKDQIYLGITNASVSQNAIAS